MNKMNRAGYRCVGRRVAFLLIVVVVTTSFFLNGLVTAEMSPGPTPSVATNTSSGSNRHREKVSEDLRERASGPSATQDQVNVILQFRDKPSGIAETALSHC